MAKAATESPTKSKAELVAVLSAQIMGESVTKPTVPTIDVDTPMRETSSRSTMKGFIKWGMMTAAFKIYTGTKSESISFNNCCPTCSSQVNAVTTCKTCSVTFEGEGSKNSLKKGYKVGGNFVFVDKTELEACEPSSNELVEVLSFVPTAEVDPIYFESTSLLSADKGGEKVLSLLRTAMIETQTMALVKITQRGRENSALLRPYVQEDGSAGIAVTYMYFDHEIRNVNFTAPASLSTEEIAFAKQLAGVMTETFAPKSLDDKYAVNVRKLIASKVAGQAAPIVPKAGKSVSSGSNLMDALKASMADAEQKRAAAAGK
jgi:DNA end-binding protein Ku